MKLSKKLKLSLIEDFFNEKIEQTIVGFSNNFEILDQVFNESYPSLDEVPIGEQFQRGKIIYNSNPTVGGYVGWVNLRTGRYAPFWKQRQKHKLGDLVASSQNGHLYECVSPGTTAYVEPLFKTQEGSITEDLHLVNEWMPEHVYTIGDIVVANDFRDRYYECVVGGVSGVEEPDWSKTVGTTFVDGSVTWLVHETVRWKEVGLAANFKPFGRIYDA